MVRFVYSSPDPVNVRWTNTFLDIIKKWHSIFNFHDIYEKGNYEVNNKMDHFKFRFNTYICQGSWRSWNLPSPRGRQQQGAGELDPGRRLKGTMRSRWGGAAMAAVQPCNKWGTQERRRGGRLCLASSKVEGSLACSEPVLVRSPHWRHATSCWCHTNIIFLYFKNLIILETMNLKNINSSIKKVSAIKKSY